MAISGLCLLTYPGWHADNVNHSCMFSVRSCNAIHGRQLPNSVGCDQGSRRSLDPCVAISSVRSIELIAASDPVQAGHFIDLVEQSDW